MAPRTKIYTATYGRDAGRSYLLTEQPASRVEEWCTQALLALARSGVDIGNEMDGTGAAGLFMLGLKTAAGINFPEAKQLMREMFECVAYAPPQGLPSRPLVDNDIEEVTTRFQLRREIFELHLGFSWADAVSKLKETSSGSTPAETSLNTPTSPG